MSHTTRWRNTLAAGSLVCAPWLALAQAAPSPEATPTPVAKTSATPQSPGRAREDVSREVREAMRDGSWRCLTNSRGYCSTPPSARSAGTRQDAAK